MQFLIIFKVSLKSSPRPDRDVKSESFEAIFQSTGSLITSNGSCMNRLIQNIKLAAVKSESSKQ